MRTTRLVSSIGIATILGAFFLSGPSVANAAPDDKCFANEVIQLDEIDRISIPDCDYSGVSVEVEDDRIFEIPELEHSVTQSPMVAEGGPHVEEVTVTRADNGELVVQTGHSLEGSSAAQAYHRSIFPEAPAVYKTDDSAVALAVEDRCRYGAPWAHLGHRWTGGAVYSWRFNSTSAPSGALAAIMDAANNWSGEHNVCGSYFLAEVYQTHDTSATATRNGLNSLGNCNVNNNQSDIYFASLDPALDYLAVTCSRSVAGVSTTSDQVYNTNFTWHTAGTGCSGFNHDLRGVATHEFGHTFGMAHVYQDSNQVMKPSSGYCDTQQRTLGRGDATGISALY